MATNSLGFSFVPNFENAAEQARSQSQVQPQGAIKTLNFRLPRVTGSATANALSPLVTQEQAGSNFGGAVLESVLRTVLGIDEAGQYAQQAAYPGAYGGDALQGMTGIPAMPLPQAPAEGVPQFADPAPAPTYAPGTTQRSWRGGFRDYVQSPFGGPTFDEAVIWNQILGAQARQSAPPPPDVHVENTGRGGPWNA